jgi:hypothetical protein
MKQLTARPLARGLRVLLPLCALAAFPAAAGAGSRELFEDAVLVRRAELIVVGRLKAGSVQKVERPEGRDVPEHRAVLVVGEVLKGACDAQEIPIVIHYGLTPRDAGGAIPIRDTGSTVRDGRGNFVGDAAEDHLWLLRRSAGYSDGAVAAEPGIADPDDLQPLALGDYFRAHLDKDPERAMRGLLGRGGSLARLARAYLDLREVRRAEGLADPAERAGRLLPYYVGSAAWWEWPEPERNRRSFLHWEARAALARCGEAAGPALRPLFEDPRHRRLREDVIRLWGEARSRAAVAPLVTLLEEYDEFWAGQRLREGWWDGASRRELRDRCREVADETYAAVLALGDIGDDCAARAVRRTQVRWRSLGVPPPEKGGPPDVASACERALKDLGVTGPAPPEKE